MFSDLTENRAKIQSRKHSVIRNGIVMLSFKSQKNNVARAPVAATKIIAATKRFGFAFFPVNIFNAMICIHKIVISDMV